MRNTNGLPFVGREPELDALRAAIDNVTQGAFRLVLLVGEPGIGKTRLAEEAAFLATQRGARTLWGRCWEGEGAPAFWPWEQILRAFVEATDGAPMPKAPAAGIEDVRRFIPELRDCLPSQESTAIGEYEPGQLRFRVFDAVARFLQEAARQQPVVLILDDLHRADEPSLILLQFLAGHLTNARILVIGAYRDIGLPAHHRLAHTVGQVARHGATLNISLTGLKPTEVAAFITKTLGHAPSAGWTDLVFATSDGNPLFVTELVKLLEHAAPVDRQRRALRTLHIPHTLHGVIASRLAQLTEGTRSLLSVASVIGREFSSQILEALDRFSVDHILASIDEALSSGILQLASGASSRYRFTHILLRDFLYSQLTIHSRSQIHLDVGSALEDSHTSTTYSSLSLLAHHFLHGSPPGDLARALAYTTRAGKAAMESLAYEEAAIHFYQAVDIMDRASASERSRCEILLALGDAQNKAGQSADARATFLEAAARARNLCEVELLCHAALGFGWEVRTGFVDRKLVQLLEEALSLLTDTHRSLRIRVLARLSRALYWSGCRARSIELSIDALTLARETGRPDLLAGALMAKYIALWSPDHLAERLDVTKELQGLATATGDREAELISCRFRVMDELERGNMASVEHWVARHSAIAEELRQPFYELENVLLRAMLLRLEGRLRQAENLIDGLDEKLESPTMNMWYWVQLFVVKRDRGDVIGLLSKNQQLCRDFHGLPVWRCNLCLLYCESGNLENALLEWKRLAQLGFDHIPKDGNWLVAISLLAEASWFLRDRPGARCLYELLTPYFDRTIVIGWAAAFEGSVAHYLALLADVIGWSDRAEAHFRLALERNETLGAPPLVARTRLCFAEMLCRRAARGDLDLAEDLTRGAIRMFETSNMRRHLRRAQELLRTLLQDDQKRPAPAGNSLRAAESQSSSNRDVGSVRSFPHRREKLNTPSSLRWEGEYWTFTFNARTLRVRDRKGVRQLAYLISQPGVQVSVLDLASLPATGAPPAAAGGLGAGFLQRTGGVLSHDAGPLADVRARRDYRDRLRDLKQELDGAERDLDPTKATALRREIEMLESEIGASFDRLGRPRRAGSILERARVSVRNSIASALRDIKQYDPALWRHLYRSVRTGALCSYENEDPIYWER